MTTQYGSLSTIANHSHPFQTIHHQPLPISFKHYQPRSSIANLGCVQQSLRTPALGNVPCAQCRHLCALGTASGSNSWRTSWRLHHHQRSPGNVGCRLPPFLLAQFLSMWTPLGQTRPRWAVSPWAAGRPRRAQQRRMKRYLEVRQVIAQPARQLSIKPA